MAKKESASSERTPAHPEVVSVYNHSDRMIEFMHMNRRAGTAGVGPEYDMIRFLPGNNKVSQSDLEKARANPQWDAHVKRIPHRTLLGRERKSILLQVGHHDDEFDIETQDLGERMHEERRKRVS